MYICMYNMITTASNVYIYVYHMITTALNVHVYHMITTASNVYIFVYHMITTASNVYMCVSHDYSSFSCNIYLLESVCPSDGYPPNVLKYSD